MAPSASPTLIDEYSQTFTSLQAGKKELIQWGADAVALNRFIVDAATESGQSDTNTVLQSIDISRVPHGDTPAARTEYCDTALKKLISLQEQVTVLQKSAREKGISGGLLTIIGQAANQSPDDNGASVLRQLSELVGPESDNATQNSNEISTQPVPVTGVTPEDSDANDIGELDAESTVPEPSVGIQRVVQTMRDHWKPLVIDVSVCAIASGIAISLVN